MCRSHAATWTRRRTTPADAPTSLEAASSFRAAGTDAAGRGRPDPSRATRSAARSKGGTPPGTGDGALSSASSRSWARGSGSCRVEFSGAGCAGSLLLRLPLTSAQRRTGRDLGYDAAVSGELAAHIVALQALASEAPAPTPPTNADRGPAHPGTQAGHGAPRPGPRWATQWGGAPANVRAPHCRNDGRSDRPPVQHSICFSA